MKYPIEILTPGECRALLSACRGRGSTNLRNAAIVAVLWRSGLRASEVLALRPKDVDLDRGELRILRGKGSKARTVALDPETAAIVQIWIDRRRSLQIGPGSPLFCTLRGNRVDPSYLRALLPRLAKRAGVLKRVHPHGLRHTFAAELAREGVPLPVISQALGHSNVATTSRYVAHVAAPEVVSTLRARTWERPAEDSRGPVGSGRRSSRQLPLAHIPDKGIARLPPKRRRAARRRRRRPPTKPKRA